MPAVSLIIPVYNVAPYLRRCVESIASQTFSDFEAIFVNDGSKDSSLTLCEELIAPYKNMRIITKENGGLSSARLCGFHEAKGQYISFIDSDDYLQPDYLLLLYKMLEDNHADVSMCSYFVSHNNEEKPIKLMLEETVLQGHEEILNKFVLPQIPALRTEQKTIPSFMWLRMFKKSLLEDSFFVSEREVFQEDLVFHLKLFRRLRKVVVSNSSLYHYCINPGSLTLRYRENAWDMMMNLYSYIDKYIPYTDLQEPHDRKIGFMYYAIMFALRNSSLKGLREYRRMVRVIRKETDDMNFFNMEIDNMSRKNKLIYGIFKLRVPLLLYYYYKRILA